MRHFLCSYLFMSPLMRIIINYLICLLLFMLIFRISHSLFWNCLQEKIEHLLVFNSKVQQLTCYLSSDFTMTKCHRRIQGNDFVYLGIISCEGFLWLLVLTLDLTNIIVISFFYLQSDLKNLNHLQLICPWYCQSHLRFSKKTNMNFEGI